ncbi:MAG: MCP four helix bundle domain-containing protein [Flammeovirgaceae bacterium]
MTIFSKVKWIIGVLLIFVIVLTTNLIDKGNFSRLRDSVTTIYEDRVVASDLIFEMTILIQEKEIALAISDTTFLNTKNDQANQELLALVARYKQTKLTHREQEIFNFLKGELENLIRLEEEYVNSESKDTIAIFKSIDEIVHHLYDLSKVQLKEGRRQMTLSNKTMESIDLFTQVEIIFLIFMAVLVQIIILYKPKQS